jgi:thiol-disulfide isomerase/thioredoxin
MKFFIRALFVFVGLTIFISSCTNNTDNTNTAGIDQSPADNTTPAEKEAGNSEYPALPEKVAQADMATLDGSTSKIADLKGKVLLLNLWATWCGFCREEMPVLVQMQDEHRDQGFEIIGVNIDDETLDQVSQFAEKMKLNYRLVWADSKLTNEFLKISKFGGIPQSFLVDREGRLRGVFTGADPRNLKKMQSLVAKLVSEE